MVDRLVERSLTSQGFPVTAQIFKDYHENLLERSNARIISTDEVKQDEPEEIEEDIYEVSAPVVGPKSSLKEVVVSLQNIHTKDLINISEVRDVSLAIGFESFEQMLNATVSLFASHRQDTHKKIMISNQVHSDRSIINFFLANSTFTATELEASQNDKASLAHISDETGTQFSFENKTDRNGKIAGMTLKFVINRATRDQKNKNLVSVVKGKKRDLARELAN
jgi:hypothetical protein